MHRISTSLSVAVVGAVLAGVTLGPGPIMADGASRAAPKPDFSSMGIDRTPVGTAKQVTRAKLARQASR